MKTILRLLLTIILAVCQLELSQAQGASLSLKWDQPAATNAAAAYHVYSVYGTNVVKTDLPGTVYNVTLTNIVERTNYTFFATAENAFSVESDASNFVLVTTPAVFPLFTISGINVLKNTNNTVNVFIYWVPKDKNIYGYTNTIIGQSAQGITNYYQTTGTNFTFTNLAFANQTLWITASNLFGAAPFATLTVTTNKPSPPTGVTLIQ